MVKYVTVGIKQLFRIGFKFEFDAEREFEIDFDIELIWIPYTFPGAAPVL